MKKTGLVIALSIVLLIVFSCSAMAFEQSISVNPLGAALGYANAKYETNAPNTENGSVTYGCTVFSMDNVTGFEFDYGSRHYFKEVQNGGYWGGEIGFASLTSTNSNYINGTGLGVVLSLGYKKTFESGLTLDGGVSAAVVTAVSSRGGSATAIGAGLYVSVGYAW